MLNGQFLLPIAEELVVDLFAGGGGASTGIEQAIGRHVDIAINHDPEAIALHAANHPQTRHYVSDVFEIDPVEVCEGRPVGLLWASPDCKHFSKAKGGKPVSKKIRGLANVVIDWVVKLGPVNKPRVIFLENVEEFQTWGPLDANNMPDPARKGETFREWKAALEAHGYVVEHRELRASGQGTPTIRKRLFLVARCDGEQIVFPVDTHAKPGTLPVKAKKLKPWRTAAECIDWSIPCPSIFDRKKPLADATLRRIAKGVMRYVVNAADPFIVGLAHGTHSNRPGPGDRSHGLDEPVRTIHAGGGNQALVVPTLAPFITEHANGSTQRVFSAGEPLRTQCAQVKGGHFALVSPTLIQTGYGERAGQAPRSLDLHAPLGTVVGGGAKHALVSAFLAQHNTGNDGHDARKPVSTIVGKGCTQGIVAAHLVHLGHGESSASGKRWSHGVRDVTDPLNTVTASGAPAGIVTSSLVKLRGTSTAQGVDEPLHTLSAQGTHFAEVRAFLVAYYGVDQDTPVTEPMHTVTTKARFGLVTVHGEEYQIVDIGLRMLTPRELYRAQGFPDSYLIDIPYDPEAKKRGRKPKADRMLTKTAQVRMCGNSVCPPMARAMVASNFKPREAMRDAA